MADWNFDRSSDAEWGAAVSALKLKQLVAERIAKRLKNHDVIGVGSGSTSFLTLRALASRAGREGIGFRAVVTSIEMERLCLALSVPVVSLAAVKPDWSFDGADEVDDSGRLLKGRGGAIFREKLIMAASSERYIVVDESKIVRRLGDRCRVPVEVFPEALELVSEQLSSIGMKSSTLRLGRGKDGPAITERGGLILDVSFENEVPREQILESIPGVLAAGVFDRWPYTLVRSDSEQLVEKTESQT